ncbi:MAG TPA: hypothetical protein VK915_12230 [Gaiellaceae bacterium]|nr:hypothetical protein [Gaiellaceae bacterium]
MGVDSFDEQERIIRHSGRILAIAFGAVGGLLVAFIAALIVVGQLGGGLSSREAMDRCTATPPGFPARLGEGVSITTMWSFWPPGYTCVYAGPAGVEEHPANAACLTSAGWCKEP